MKRTSSKESSLTRGATPYRPRSPRATSFLMSRVRSTNSKMEILLRSALHLEGYRFRKNFDQVLGKPDIAFVREKVAVFVDGDYWHARILKERGIRELRKSLKTSNREFWIAKLRRNVKRDAKVTKELKKQGWIVIRLWETDVKQNLKMCVDVVTLGLANQRRELSYKATHGSF
jgi:DNA mismatch endonuclease (patch repair protein)